MSFHEFKKRALKTFYPALVLESVLPERVRKKLERGLSVVFTITVLAALAPLFAELAILSALAPYTTILLSYANIIYGVLFLVLGIRIVFFFLDAFCQSYYFKGLDTVLHEHGRGEPVHMSFEVARIVYGTPGEDITAGFIKSPLGRSVLARSGIFSADINKFISSREPSSFSSSAQPDFNEDITLSKYAEIIFKEDKAFAQFLFTHELQEGDFVGAARWVERAHHEFARRKRFWSRDNLGKIPGIGKAWSYGQAFTLERYGEDIATLPVYQAARSSSSVIGKRELELLENTLARTHEANAILVGEEGIGKIEIVARLARRIESGEALPPLEHKKAFVLDTDALIAAAKEKGTFEENFIKLLNEAVRAGNIILVIQNLSGFIKSADRIGTDIVSILEPYLTGSSLQVVATSDKSSFHSVIQADARLTRRFESILVGSADESSVVAVLEGAALSIEMQHGTFFTYPALVAVFESAERYFPASVMPDKAVDLLQEAATITKETKRETITKQDILNFVATKTGVPVGEIGAEEKDKLLNLGSILHEYIVGQERAVKAIASAMQRARSGVRNPDRPMGSFLFLGPTGVGKTETAKTLAQVFFGSREHMLRLDMSEYNTPEAVARLTGSFESGKTGTLVSMLREQQYGVLLLDEFEKTHEDVHDLFLQIFDEGEFTDARGKKVNARELIIIATSNAGSDLIWEYFKKGEDVTEHEKDLIDEIVKKGLFKPELLNRFDGTIVFHPLSEEHIRRIAALMLERFRARLKERGIDLVINDALISMLVERGYNPKFGARPMNRAIQDNVEQVVAEKMLRGEIEAGEKVELTAADFE